MAKLPAMLPGLYVVRMPARGTGLRLIVESVAFVAKDAEWNRLQADKWCDFVQGQHPKDDVFVIERPAKVA